MEAGLFLLPPRQHVLSLHSSFWLGTGTVTGTALLDGVWEAC